MYVALRLHVSFSSGLPGKLQVGLQTKQSVFLVGRPFQPPYTDFHACFVGDCLVIGPVGVGKTLLLKAITKFTAESKTALSPFPPRRATMMSTRTPRPSHVRSGMKSKPTEPEEMSDCFLVCLQFADVDISLSLSLSSFSIMISHSHST